jgi:hypothetical protein
MAQIPRVDPTGACAASPCSEPLACRSELGNAEPERNISREIFRTIFRRNDLRGTHLSYAPAGLTEGFLGTRKAGAAMRFHPCRCPECGEAAEGTHELVPGLALLTFDGQGEAEYAGETELDWNGQRTIHDEAGRVTLSCPRGHAWQAQMEEDE